MLEQVGSIFEQMIPMLKKLKQKTYEPRMQEFRETYGHFYQEMTDYIDSQDEKEAAIDLVAATFVQQVQKTATEQGKGKISGRRQVDMNFFMIYFGFPALLLTEHPQADALAGAICKKWGETFKDSQIGYTTFEKLNGSFRNKIFGIF